MSSVHVKGIGGRIFSLLGLLLEFLDVLLVILDCIFQEFFVEFLARELTHLFQFFHQVILATTDFQRACNVLKQHVGVYARYR